MKCFSIKIGFALISTIFATSDYPTTKLSDLELVPPIPVNSFLFPDQSAQFITIRKKLYFDVLNRVRTLLDFKDDKYYQKYLQDIVDTLIVHYHNWFGLYSGFLGMEGNLMKFFISKNVENRIKSANFDDFDELDLSFHEIKEIPIEVLQLLKPKILHLEKTGISGGLVALKEVQSIAILNIGQNKIENLMELNCLPPNVKVVIAPFNPFTISRIPNMNKNGTITTFTLSRDKEIPAAIMGLLRKRFEAVNVIYSESPAVCRYIVKEDDLKRAGLISNKENAGKTTQINISLHEYSTADQILKYVNSMFIIQENEVQKAAYTLNKNVCLCEELKAADCLSSDMRIKVSLELPQLESMVKETLLSLLPSSSLLSNVQIQLTEGKHCYSEKFLRLLKEDAENTNLKVQGLIKSGNSVLGLLKEFKSEISKNNDLNEPINTLANALANATVSEEKVSVTCSD